MKYARLSLILAVILPSSLLMAQSQTPDFMMPIWFEDALGNRDTVRIGKDLQATSSGGMDTQFGEVTIFTPYDSVFEVRAINADDVNNIGSKVIVEHRESTNKTIPFAGTKIMIHAIHLPVTISWDTTYLINSGYCCYDNSFFVDNYMPFVVPQWWSGHDFECLIGQSQFQTYLIDNSTWMPWQLHYLHDVEGQGVKTILGYYLNSKLGPPAPFCMEQSVGVGEEAYHVEPYLVYPNPVHDNIHIKARTLSDSSPLESAVLFEAFTGKQLRVWLPEELSNGVLAVGDLPSGMYFLKLQTQNRLTEYHRVVKVN